jgi:hypothetical protein
VDLLAEGTIGCIIFVAAIEFGIACIFKDFESVW